MVVPAQAACLRPSALVLQPEIVIFMVRTLAAGSGIAWRGAGGVAARWTIAGGARCPVLAG